jgi:hypothetical protein
MKIISTFRPDPSDINIFRVYKIVVEQSDLYLYEQLPRGETKARLDYLLTSHDPSDVLLGLTYLARIRDMEQDKMIKRISSHFGIIQGEVVNDDED